MRSENHCDYCHAVFVRDKRDVRETLNRVRPGLPRRPAATAGRCARWPRRTRTATASSNDVGVQGAARIPATRRATPRCRSRPPEATRSSALRKLSPVARRDRLPQHHEEQVGRRLQRLPRQLALGDACRRSACSTRPTSVDLLSADGYEHTFTLDELKKSWPQGAAGHGPRASRTSGACGWVTLRLAPARGRQAAAERADHAGVRGERPAAREGAARPGDGPARRQGAAAGDRAPVQDLAAGSAAVRRPVVRRRRSRRNTASTRTTSTTAAPARTPSSRSGSSRCRRGPGTSTGSRRPRARLANEEVVFFGALKGR